MRTIVRWVLTKASAFCCLSLFSASCFLVAQTPKTIHGNVVDHTYSDPRYGLRYTFPADLENMTSLPNGVPVGTGEKQGVSELMLSAMEAQNGRVRRGVMITSDPIGVFGARDASSYLRQMVKLSMGAKEPIDLRSVTIAGKSFARTDVGIGVQIRSYGAQLATICGSDFLTFYFSGPSPARVEELVRSLDQLSISCPAGKH